MPLTYDRRMIYFFTDWSEIDAFLDKLLFMRCPKCGASGTLGRHGFIKGWVDDSDVENVRARRIRCRPKKGGCGKTWSLRCGDRLFRFCFGTMQAWEFLKALRQKQSVKAA